MRIICDYMFVKLYQWTEFLNRINRKYGIDWEDDSLWCAIFGLSVLQSVQVFSIGMVLVYLFECKEYVFPTGTYLPKDVGYIIFLFIWVAPLVTFYYFNKKRYEDKKFYTRIIAKFQKNKVSNVWAVLYFVATLVIFILSVSLNCS